MKMKRIVSLVVASAFFVNNIAYGLSPMPGSTQPGTKDAMYASGQKLFAAKIGPGAIGFDIPPGEFKELQKNSSGKLSKYLDTHNTKFIGADYNNPPADWKNNPILQETDLITALKIFRARSKISPDKLEIKEGWFQVDEKAGELPIARIEPLGNGKYALIVHTKFVQMWNHIRKNDVWFEADLKSDERRTVSVAWGIFYRLAKHEMAELSKRDGTFKGEGRGHFAHNLDVPHENEDLANTIGGNYAMLNDAMWMWFLGSYAFRNTTRYDNNLFFKRVSGFFYEEWAMERGLDLEFPNLLMKPAKQTSTMAFACAINKNFFGRPGVEVPKTYEVKKEFINRYHEREIARELAGVTEKSIYATGGGANKDSGKPVFRGEDVLERDVAVELLDIAHDKAISAEDGEAGYVLWHQKDQLEREDESYSISLRRLLGGLTNSEAQKFLKEAFREEHRVTGRRAKEGSGKPVFRGDDIFVMDDAVELLDIAYDRAINAGDGRAWETLRDQRDQLKKKERSDVIPGQELLNRLATSEARKFLKEAYSEQYSAFVEQKSDNGKKISKTVRRTKPENSPENLQLENDQQLTGRAAAVSRNRRVVDTGDRDAEAQVRGRAKAASRTRAGKSPEDLLKLIAFTRSEGRILSAPVLLELYEENYEELGFEKPAEKRNSALKTIERDLYIFENSLLRRGLVQPLFEDDEQRRGADGEYLFELTKIGREEVVKSHPLEIVLPSPMSAGEVRGRAGSLISMLREAGDFLESKAREFNDKGLSGSISIRTTFNSGNAARLFEETKSGMKYESINGIHKFTIASENIPHRDFLKFALDKFKEASEEDLFAREMVRTIEQELIPLMAKQVSDGELNDAFDAALNAVGRKISGLSVQETKALLDKMTKLRETKESLASSTKNIQSNPPVEFDFDKGLAAVSAMSVEEWKEYCDMGHTGLKTFINRFEENGLTAKQKEVIAIFPKVAVYNTALNSEEMNKYFTLLLLGALSVSGGISVGGYYHDDKIEDAVLESLVALIDIAERSGENSAAVLDLRILSKSLIRNIFAQESAIEELKAWQSLVQHGLITDREDFDKNFTQVISPGKRYDDYNVTVEQIVDYLKKASDSSEIKPYPVSELQELARSLSVATGKRDRDVIYQAKVFAEKLSFLMGGKTVEKAKELVTVEESPIAFAISEYVIDIGLNKGPGSVVEPTVKEIAAFYPIYEILSRQAVEICLPQAAKGSLTDAVIEEIADLNKRIRERTGRKDDAISFKAYDSNNIEKLLENRPEGTRRIFVNDNTMTDLFKDLLSQNKAAALKGSRLITTSIPQIQDKKELSVYQAWLIKVALLSAMVEESNMLTVGSALREELKDRLDNDIDINEFVKNLAGTENEAIEQVAARINYFLGKIVKISQFIGEQIHILKAFWIAA